MTLLVVRPPPRLSASLARGRQQRVELRSSPIKPLVFGISFVVDGQLRS